MPKYKLSAEERAAKQERREKLGELMAELEVQDVSDINALFKEMEGAILENGLEAEMDEELGYSRYDYRNKQGQNSRNGHSNKTMKTALLNLDL